MIFGPFELSLIFFLFCFLGSAMMFFAPDEEDIDNDDMEKKEFILEDIVNDTNKTPVPEVGIALWVHPGIYESEINIPGK